MNFIFSLLGRLRAMSLSSQIVMGLIAGVALGIFLGEAVAPVSVIADGYVLLLQMTVLPYILVSVVAGLGSLTPLQARMIFTRVGLLLMLLWLISLAFAFVIPLAFPSMVSASFFSTSLIEQRPPFDFLNLYIPANPFHALANNVVPAVVVFSVVLGIALIRIENKEQVLSFLDILAKALSKVTRFVVRLTPIGLFAIGANLAGTLRLDELARVQMYILTFGAMAVLLTLWVLPALITTLTPVGYREILKLTGDALITAFMTGNLFVVLPILSDAARSILERHTAVDSEAAGMPDVIVPASFNFPHSGKALSISFILFAAWFAGVSFSPVDHFRLAVLGLLSYFGSLTAAIPYLLDLFRIPIDTFQLFLATGLVNSRFGSALAAMHTFALAVLGAAAMSGILVIKPRKIIRFVAITSLLTVVTVLGLRFLFVHVVDHKYTKGDLLKGMELTRKQVPASMLTIASQPLQMTGVLGLERIQDRGAIRVGYLPDSIPYAYTNSRGALVGFDIDMAHQLAGEMAVSLEFVVLDREKVPEQINSGFCDILMSGYALTTNRARNVLLTTSYLDDHLAFLTLDYRRNDFIDHASIKEQSGLRIGVPNVPYYLAKLREYAPHAELVILKSFSEPLENSLQGLDAIAISAERGSSWSLLYPQYSVVVPQPNVLTIPITYAVGRHDHELLSFLNSWLELKKKDGTVQQLYDYWILGKNAEPRTPRWCIVRDVLHWIQ